MEMGDWYLFTKQFRRIYERIRIRGLLLWVEYGPCLIYERRGIQKGIPIIFVWRVLREIKRKDLL